ncbi:MAG: glycoside hydrolase, partial [Anaerolineales bacterium]|nr:glycoside hydrolase [Anaerolineales bacterium]
MRTPRSMIFWLLLLAFNFLIAVVVPSDTSAQDQGWSRPFELSTDSGGWFPDVATDRFGRVHVVWASTIRKTDGGIYDVVMYRGHEVTPAWTEPVDIASLKQLGGSYATRPVLTVDHADGFHLTFRNAIGVQYTRTNQLQLDRASNWEEPQVIAYGYFSEVVKDGSGRLHLIYTTNVPTTDCSVCFHVFYRSSDNQGLSWSIPMDISILPTGAAKPSIVIDSEDRLHVAWEAGVGGDLGQLSGPVSILYTRRDPSTQRWSTPAELSDTGMDVRNVAIAIDGRDRLIVA